MCKYLDQLKLVFPRLKRRHGISEVASIVTESAIILELQMLCQHDLAIHSSMISLTLTKLLTFFLSAQARTASISFLTKSASHGLSGRRAIVPAVMSYAAHFRFGERQSLEKLQSEFRYGDADQSKLWCMLSSSSSVVFTKMISQREGRVVSTHFTRAPTEVTIRRGPPH